MNFRAEEMKKQALRNSCELLRQRKELYASSWTDGGGGGGGNALLRPF